MHISACILLFPIYMHCINSMEVRICMYMYVYACIRMYMMYLHVFCMYMHVFTEMTPLDTGTDATTPIHSPKGWQSAGSTQGTPGHLSIHFFPPSATFVQTRFGAPHPRGTRPGPLELPSCSTRRSPTHDSRTTIQPHGLSHQVWLVGIRPEARERRLNPLKNTS